MSLSSEGEHLSANQIPWKYLNPQLRYNYFQFGKTTIRHTGTVLSSFAFGDRFRKSVLISEPNSVVITQSTAEI